MERLDAFDAVFFDWDGTVIDSIGSVVGCALDALRDCGLPPVDEERIRHTVGLGLHDVMAQLLPDGTPAQRKDLVEAYRQRWIHHYRGRALLYPGAEEAIAWLADHDRLLAVATGKGRGGLDHDLEITGLGRFFHATRTADQSRPKPDPAMVLELLDELGLRPNRTLMVGDTTYDLDMASSAGVPGVALLRGAHPEDLLRSRAPLACLPSIADLIGWLAASPDAS
ncbi:MAG: HAD-IA family hydrolase [Acidobacteriota bacterium]